MFRKWTTQLLKDYLKGYTINQQRLQKQAEQLNELKEAIKILETTLEYKKLTSDESTGLLKSYQTILMPSKFLTDTIIRH